MKPFTQKIRPSDVEALIDLSVEGAKDTRSMALQQATGIAALYDILCDHPVAYLADEVGMGKTYQALGLAALLWSEKPSAHILFISPRENLQVKWHGDYLRFFASNYRRPQELGDDRVSSVLFRAPVHRPVVFHHLGEWALTLGLPDPIAPFVRHTRFTRPIYVREQDTSDLDALWERTRQRMETWGLFEAARPRGLTAQNASWQLNRTFAWAVNAKLAAESKTGRYFDLVIIDEAQCLRHHDNQTNTVLHDMLDGQVEKWLFMSATPAHGGASDLPTILNHYPRRGDLLDPGSVSDLGHLQAALQPFMVRRQRRYQTTLPRRSVRKQEYRQHALDGWAVRDQDMSTLGALAMGLVQKNLVGVLEERSNRYQIGFLSSFESLSASLKRTIPAPGDDEEEDGASDFFRDKNDGATEREAPDTGFIETLTTKFVEHFGRPLPHPKLDAVIDRVAPRAFGTNAEEGGEKFLIFTRRISTVDALKEGLTRRYERGLEDRIARYWRKNLDWSGGVSDQTPTSLDEGGEDPEGFEAAAGESKLRLAMARNGWLFRFRQTFRDTGRNALLFEDGWLERLCRAGGVRPERAARELPDELWAESWAHASRKSGQRRQQHRADRVRYLALQGLLRFPEVFGLGDARKAAPWREAYEAALHEHATQARPAPNPHRAPELFTEPTLWTAWDVRFKAEHELVLPAARAEAYPSAEALHRRQVARTLLGQTFRLTDPILDLYYADLAVGRDSTRLPARFLDYLTSDDPGARLARNDAREWLAHLRLIVDNCLDGAGKPWSELARTESWPQLFNPQPIIGVVGGSGGHVVATRQFRTPSLPRVLVATDTLKEGVDLHLFCDRVVHYGVAWTSGDLEQRVGRVDRFFSRIERRLAKAPPPESQLEVGYPHLVASIERGQVERVLERQKEAEDLMDSPLGGASKESRELVVGALSRATTGERLEAFPKYEFPRTGRTLVSLPSAQAAAVAEHYGRWYQDLAGALEKAGWRLTPDGRKPVRTATVSRDSQHSLAWSYDARLGRYVLTLSDPPWGEATGYSGGRRRRIVERRRKEERFFRLLVPTPAEGLDRLSIAHLLDALEGVAPHPDSAARVVWSRPLNYIATEGVEWLSDHKARLVVDRAERKHLVTVYAYEGGVRVVGIVSDLDRLQPRPEWGDPVSVPLVRTWAAEVTNDLPLGYLDVHERDGLVFGVHVLHGRLSAAARRSLVQQVAWRADEWEAALTGQDRI